MYRSNLRFRTDGEGKYADCPAATLRNVHIVRTALFEGRLAAQCFRAPRGAREKRCP